MDHKHMTPPRCGRCHACTYAKSSFKTVLSQASPPFSDMTRILKRWSEVMDRYPCPRGR